MQFGNCHSFEYNPSLVENMERSYVSSNFIRNKSSPSNISNDYAHYDSKSTNNPPSTSIYVRLDPISNKYVLNGKLMPRLVLTRGKKYQFNVVTPGKPFYLFTSIQGVGQTTQPTDNYRFTITVDNNWPTEFFYGCFDNEGSGSDSKNGSKIIGKVIIK